MSATDPESGLSSDLWRFVVEVMLLMALLFTYAGDPSPMVNEAHYLVKAKNYWQPDWCANDLFAASGKAHTTFYLLFGWPTLFASMETTTWLGRIVGWLILAIGLQQLCWQLFRVRYVSLAVAILWIVGIERANLAGEWVVGGIEAKVPAYGLVLLALAALVQRKWHRVWPLLGAASAFHVLTGGWSVIAAMMTWLLTERGRPDGVKLLTPALFLGGLISLFGLVPALALNGGADPADATAAARIYAYFRIKHHLLPSDFLPWWYVRHALLIVLTLVLGWLGGTHTANWNRMRLFTYGALAIAAVGLLVGLLPAFIPDLAARLLRYYWFRLSDAMVPLLMGLYVMRLLVRCGQTSSSGDGAETTTDTSTIDPPPASQIGRLAAGITLMLATFAFVDSSYQKTRLGVAPSVSNRLLGWDADASPSQQQRVAADWRAVCRWARDSSAPDEVFLTPRHQQSFKWYAGRAEVVNWKDVPQDAASLREWYRRFREVFPRRLGTLRVTIQYSKLREFRERYGVEYLIVDRRVSGENLPLVRVFPGPGQTNASYAVYRLPAPKK